MRNMLTDKQKSDVVKHYMAGRTLTEITALTGAPRSSIYFVLGQHGIKPSRPRGRNADARKRAERMAPRIDRQLAQQNYELKQENRTLRRALEAMAATIDGVLGK